MAVWPLYEEARRLASEGIPVFPCNLERKPETPNGFYDASVDEHKHEMWFTGQLAYVAMGVPTGHKSRAFVLDVDVKRHNGFEALDEWYKDYGALPTTVTSETGSGGRHLYFQMPRDYEVRNSEGALALGVDIRGEGGFIIMPPSMHKSGARYKYLGDPLAHGKVAAAPEWLIEKIKAAKAPKPAAVNDEPQRVLEGSRNSTLFRCGCGLRGYGASDAVVSAALRTMNAEQCEPPLEEGELVKVINSVLGYEAGPVDDGVINPFSLNGKVPLQHKATIMRFSEIEQREHTFLVKPILPDGSLVLMDGDPQSGKTFLALRFCAAVTQGETIPPLTTLVHHEKVPQGNALYFTSEDSIEATLLPRFIAMGGDQDRMYTQVLSTDINDVGVTMETVQLLEQIFESVRPKICVFDTIQSFLGSRVDPHKAYDVRMRLGPVRNLADKYGTAVVLITQK